MVLSKKRIALAVALGLAVAALAVDRLLLDSSPMQPDEAAASAISQYGLAEPVADTASLEKLEPPALLEPTGTLTDRLEDLAKARHLDGQSVRDAFRPPEAWLPAEPKQQAPKPRDEVDRRAKEFARQHKLTATAISATGGMAIIDGQCVTVGNELDGFRLVSVDRVSACLIADGARVKLGLAENGPTDGRD